MILLIKNHSSLESWQTKILPSFQSKTINQNRSPFWHQKINFPRYFLPLYSQKKATKNSQNTMYVPHSKHPMKNNCWNIDCFLWICSNVFLCSMSSANLTQILLISNIFSNKSKVDRVHPCHVKWHQNISN